MTVLAEKKKIVMDENMNVPKVQGLYMPFFLI